MEFVDCVNMQNVILMETTTSLLAGFKGCKRLSFLHQHLMQFFKQSERDKI